MLESIISLILGETPGQEGYQRPVAVLSPRNDEHHESGLQGEILVNPFADGVAVLSVDSRATDYEFRLEASAPLEISPSPIQSFMAYNEAKNTITFADLPRNPAGVRLLIEIDESFRGKQREEIRVLFHDTGEVAAKQDVEIRSRVFE